MYPSAVSALDNCSPLARSFSYDFTNASLSIHFFGPCGHSARHEIVVCVKKISHGCTRNARRQSHVARISDHVPKSGQSARRLSPRSQVLRRLSKYCAVHPHVNAKRANRSVRGIRRVVRIARRSLHVSLEELANRPAKFVFHRGQFQSCTTASFQPFACSGAQLIRGRGRRRWTFRSGDPLSRQLHGGVV